MKKDKSIEHFNIEYGVQKQKNIFVVCAKFYIFVETYFCFIIKSMKNLFLETNKIRLKKKKKNNTLPRKLEDMKHGKGQILTQICPIKLYKLNNFFFLTIIIRVS